MRTWHTIAEAREGSTRYALGGHKQLGVTGPLAVRRAALASAGCAWCWAAFLHKPRGTIIRCICQGLAPSKPRLTWVCPFTAVCQQGLAQPGDRAAERLFAAPISEWPRAPPAISYQELVSDIAEHCSRLLSQGGVVQVATDGSAFEGIGGYAVVTSAPDGLFATGDDSEDQSAYRQEALACLALVRGLLQLAGKCSGKVQILCDCEAVRAGVKCPEASALPALMSEISCAAAALEASELRIDFIWVPSHGKRPLWEAPCGLDSAACRALNANADAAANAARAYRWQYSARRRWHQEYRAAVSRETAAIKASAGASEILKAHLQGPGPAPLP